MIDALMILPGLIIGMVIHELAHAWMAKRFGDNTAESQGRITLNPIAHVDPFGSILLPILGLISGGFLFGWAKPVPINPNNFSHYKKGMFWVSFAGPLSNLLIGLIFQIFIILIFISPTNIFQSVGLVGFDQFLIKILYQGIYINAILAFFNLIPFPPLDGSKMLSVFLPVNYQIKLRELESRGGYFILLIFLFMGGFKFIMIPTQIYMKTLALIPAMF
jgi:Zn-dependent protease